MFVTDSDAPGPRVHKAVDRLPENALFDRLICLRSGRLPSHGGIDPVSWLELRSRLVRDVKRAIEAGRLPLQCSKAQEG